MRITAILIGVLLISGCGEDHTDNTESSAKETNPHMLDSQQKALNAAKDTARALEEAAEEEAARIRQATGS